MKGVGKRKRRIEGKRGREGEGGRRANIGK